MLVKKTRKLEIVFNNKYISFIQTHQMNSRIYIYIYIERERERGAFRNKDSKIRNTKKERVNKIINVFSRNKTS